MTEQTGSVRSAQVGVREAKMRRTGWDLDLVFMRIGTGLQEVVVVGDPKRVQPRARPLFAPCVPGY